MWPRDERIVNDETSGEECNDSEAGSDGEDDDAEER